MQLKRWVAAFARTPLQSCYCCSWQLTASIQNNEPLSHFQNYQVVLGVYKSKSTVVAQ